MTVTRADKVSAWMTGVGVGFIALMVTWLAGARLAGLVWDPPVGPIVALATAWAVGITTAVLMGRRLVRTIHQ